ncbi:MAG: hypothetical protein VXW32_13955 [Myxococcota bacterium]|nr:hypothetical protein [Myxococcota bacterium]
MPQPCPKCQRPNGSHRETCLYCGHRLQRADAEDSGSKPDEEAIERAVFAALSGGASPSAPDASRLPPASRPPEVPEQPAPPPQSDAPDALELIEAPPAKALEPPEKPRENFAEQMLSGVSASIAVEAAGLPLGRRPFVLVVEGRGDLDLALPMAAITGLDHVTTRMVAASEWDRPLLWAVDREGLDSMAENITQQLGLRASVHQTSSLAALEGPQAILGWQDGGVLTTEKPIWMGASLLDEAGEMWPFEGVTLAVSGQVEIRRFLEQRRGRWSRNKGSTERREIGERRVVLLDLHGPRCFFRIVLGLTNFRGAPFFREGSAVLSMKALFEGLPEVFPGIHLEGKRVAHAQGARAMQDSESERSSFEITGWSAWEEHTRICRAHRGLPLEIAPHPVGLPT